MKIAIIIYFVVSVFLTFYSFEIGSKRIKERVQDYGHKWWFPLIMLASVAFVLLLSPIVALLGQINQYFNKKA